MEKKSFVIFTIGHGSKPIDEFVSLLKAYEIQRVVDVRTVPRSRHNPQFNKDALPETLRKTHIGYIHMKGLGGLRHARKDSENTAWRNASFRGFADYMQTTEFTNSLERLIKIAGQKRITIMCAESVPWRCHRSLIADALFVCGIPVKHIMSLKTSNDHKLTPWAKVKGFQVTYPYVEDGNCSENCVAVIK